MNHNMEAASHILPGAIPELIFERNLFLKPPKE